MFGNDLYPNQLLMSKGEGASLEFDEALDSLVGVGSHRTHALALGDFNGDGSLDLIVGNFAHTETNQLFLNEYPPKG